MERKQHIKLKGGGGGLQMIDTTYQGRNVKYTTVTVPHSPKLPLISPGRVAVTQDNSLERTNDTHDNSSSVRIKERRDTNFTQKMFQQSKIREIKKEDQQIQQPVYTFQKDQEPLDFH